jgi:adenosylcobinamide-phosphate guanylyltransferase
MCGGRGTRLDVAAEKPLYAVGGRRMVDRVRDALVDSRVDTVYAVTSPNAPETREHVAPPRIDAPGAGYVEDLGVALDRVEPPVLTVAADLPLLSGDAVDAALDAHTGGNLAVCVPVALKRVLGVSVDATMDRDEEAVAPTGINVVSERDTEAIHMSYDVRHAVNVNRLADARIAEALL